jgi:transposase-like protein
MSMKRICPNLNCAAPENIILDGHFRRMDDAKFIQRYRCKSCSRRFSSATMTETFRQKKRRINAPLLELLASGFSLRRAAKFLKVHPTTVERKLRFLSKKCARLNDRSLSKLKGQVFNVQFDDLITKENSKLKPLSVTVAVDEDRRRILGVEVSQIPAFGHLSKIAIKKYGPRQDQHLQGLDRLFEKISPFISSEAVVKSDMHHLYPGVLATYLPRAKHLQFKSERACVAGQGELKKVQFDPLFIVNHTCAMLRANVNRLIRKTWCTTKDPKRLKDHLNIFTYYYNEVFLLEALTPL